MTPDTKRPPTIERELPEPVATFVRATNEGRLDALLAVFAEDALVNDQLREHWHKDTIARWAADEVIGQRLCVVPVKVVSSNEQVVVTARVDGNFDKRGLPDPLMLSFYFSVRQSKIVQLVILRNEEADGSPETKGRDDDDNR
jgi:hypothetical protein